MGRRGKQTHFSEKGLFTRNDGGSPLPALLPGAAGTSRPGTSRSKGRCHEGACHSRAGLPQRVTASPHWFHCRSSSPTNLQMSWASSSGSSKAAKWPPRAM